MASLFEHKMKRRLVSIFAIVSLGLTLSCSLGPEVVEPISNEIQSAAPPPEVSFEDQTHEIVDHAQRLIEKNQREGAVFDQKWYGFRRFGEYQELFLAAERVLFYGGLEADVRAHIRGQYRSVIPLKKDQETGEIRVFAGRLDGGKWDYILIGQNGREVALKTVIRLLYMAKFADEDMKRRHRLRLPSFSKSLKVFLSPVSPSSEYLTFFKKYGIESTIVDLTREEPRLLRPGSIARDELQRVLGRAVVDADGDAPRASGRLERHYAPRTPLELVAVDDVERRIGNLAPERVATLAPIGSVRDAANVVLSIEASDDPAAYATSLYADLHRLDAAGAHRIIVAEPSSTPQWDAIRDRLHKAAAGSTA
jgi:hypothetical protein